MRTLHETDASALEAAATALRAGEVIVVPTDTVYGVAALPGLDGAAHRIYVAKGRPGHLQLPVLAASLDQVHALGVEFTARGHHLGRPVVARPLDAGVRLFVRRRPDRSGWRTATKWPCASLRTTSCSP